jgi:hypothetical protein
VANKSQDGRGTVTVTTIPNIPTLDLSELTDKQHAKAKEKFVELKGLPLRPLNEINRDENRAQIDRAILVDVLRLPEELISEDGPIPLLREKLAAEPQICGGKLSVYESHAGTDE